jgi:hypothetical protein
MRHRCDVGGSSGRAAVASSLNLPRPSDTHRCRFNPGGISVSDNQSGKAAKLALIFEAVSAWNIYDIMTATEVPRQTVMIMQYVFLAGTLLGLVMALVKLASAK